MSKKGLIGIVVLIAMCLTFNGQTPVIDSLMSLLNSYSGSAKVEILAELSKQHYQVNPVRGIVLGREALRLADSLKMPSLKTKAFNSLGANYLVMNKIDTARLFFYLGKQNAGFFHDSSELATALSRLGILCEMEGKYDSALICMKEGYEIFRRIKEEEQAGRTLENIGVVYLNRGELKSALTSLLDAKALFKNSKATKSLPYLHLKLGRVYAESKEWDEAVKWYRQGILGSERLGDKMRAATGLNALGILYKETGKYDSALILYRNALSLAERLNNQNLVAAVYGNMGNVYEKQGLFKEAYLFHEKAMKIGQALKNRILVAQEKAGMGKASLEMKDYYKARSLLEEARIIFEETGSKSYLLTIYENLIRVNNAVKDYAVSVKYYQAYIKVKDSLNRYEHNKSLDSLRVAFKTEQTKLENVQLIQQNELNRQTISLQRTLIISGFLVSTLMIVVIFQIIRNRNRMKKAYQLLEKQNQEITFQSKELTRLNGKLTELSQFKDNMNSFLVHDLKNSLSAMIHYGLSEHTPQQAETFRHLAGQMLVIITNILDINKYENDQMPLKPASVPLKSILSNALQETGYLAQQKRVRVVFHSDKRYRVLVDQDILKRVFINLLHNAIKYSPTGGEVTISSTRHDPDVIRVEIRDQGEGIDPDFLPYIFDKYTQDNPRPSGGLPSTGLGLTFCRLAVESMGGGIGVNPAPDTGTVFWFTVPAASETVADENYETQETVIPKEELLLTEEEKREIAEVCTRLKSLAIYCVSDIKEAISRISSDTPGIIRWKSMILQSMYTCDENRFKEMIDIDGEATV